MGYTLKIGEATLKWSDHYVDVDCNIVRLDEAPAFGEPTDNESQRWPSYSSWASAMRELGLMDVMFNERNNGAGEFDWKGEAYYPLMPTHPGASPIARAHVEYVEAKLDEYKSAHPAHRAQFPPLKPGAERKFGIYSDDDLVDDPTYDGWLCRGEWLAFWLRWALENCKQPVFVNS